MIVSAISVIMLEKFIRIYTMVVTTLIVAALIGAGYCFFGMDYPVAAVGCLFLAVLFALMLFVTRTFVHRNQPKAKKKGARW